MIGIPIGINPATLGQVSFHILMSSLISSDKVKASHFYCTRRFIDNLSAINDVGEFENIFFGNISKRAGVKG